MPCRKIILLILCCFFSVKTFADVFVVTSNADSGPGTLRDALTKAAANGASVKDYINFNLTDQSEAGRNITLVTQLPDLSSNLVIDGTTQAGGVFGDSNARIEITTPHNNIAFVTFNGTNLNDVEFYGLYIYDYSGTNISRPDLKSRYGIYLNNSTNIIIGAAGKGNLMRGFNQSVIELLNSNFITLQGNVIGLGKYNDFNDDETDMLYDYTANVYLYSCNNILVGGDMSQTNLFFTPLAIPYGNGTTGNVLDIKSNNFGVFRGGKTISLVRQDVGYVDIETTSFSPQTGNQVVSATINIENNLCGNFSNAFKIVQMQGSANFFSNYIGISRDGSVDLDDVAHTGDGTAIDVENCTAQITVGGTDPSKQNFIAYSSQAVAASNANFILIRNNQYECLSQGAYVNSTPAALPVIAINSISSNSTSAIITGTCTPNAIVEIYGSEGCKYNGCSIRSLIQTTAADASGNWKSNNLNYNNGVFYVSATVAHTTSVFATFKIDQTNKVIVPLRCNNIASISGLTVPPGLSYYWIDSKGNVVSTDLVLKTNTPGKYQLVLSGGCIKSNVFEILDQGLKIDDSGLQKTNVDCGINSGSIKGLIFTDPLYLTTNIVWTDANGKVVSNTVNAVGLAIGSYTFTAKSTDGCSVTYGPVVIGNSTAPTAAQLQILQNSPQIINDGCSLKTGSIKGIQVTGGFPPYKYLWTDGAGKTVATSADLTGVGAGTYTVTVTDAGACSVVQAIVITTYTVENQDIGLTAPSVNGTQLCSPGSTVISVNNPVSVFTYKLYQSPNASAPVSIAADGRFTVNVKVNTVFYVSQASGNCESTRTPVTVLVGIGAGDIPNTITPNADGVNDYWNIPAIANYPQCVVHVYNRNGQQVFESRGYATPFNGTYNGKPLPDGTYYYMIELSSSCSLLSGSLTLVR